MEINSITFQEIDKHKHLFGAKTLNLKKCVDWSFNVPEFVPLPSSISKSLFEKKDFRDRIANETDATLQKNKYAVRSSALIEDAPNQSYAGQFLTKTNLSSEELSDGIFEVLKHANDFLKGDIDKFSIIVQEYIEADISGIAFTRNPNGSREMVIEYGFCEGEKIVSGAVMPSKASFYWNDKLGIKNLPKQFLANQVVEKFKELESRMSFPQDIEWCIKDNEFYILQARPITTISKEQYEQILFLDDFLPRKEKYYFEKTEISEIAPRPSVATYDLLNLIYSEGGPVDKVYKKYGVRYKNTGFLKIIGNELFVDKEKEIQGLLPSYSYLGNKNFIPKFHSFSLLTIRNFLFLNKIKTNSYEKIFESLKIKIETKQQGTLDLKISLDNFLADYELIFEINLLSGLAIKKVNLLLKKEPINFTQIAGGYSNFIDLTKYDVQCPKNLKGNSLELSDKSAFIGDENIKNKKNDEVVRWWGELPEYRKKMLQNVITEAIIYDRLREFGRWLTLKNTNALKDSLLDYAVKNKFKHKENIFFANLGVVLKSKVKESDCIKNKSVHEKYDHFNIPSSITSSLLIRKTDILGVSSGLASGILKSQDMIDAKKSKGEKCILFTEMLSPDLTKYFDKISGIVSSNGGLLSHLAIMAREQDIPVIVGFSISDSEIKIGDNVRIDGGNGKISK